MKRIWIPQVVTSAMLIWALKTDNPYAYYVLLRWVCCASFSYIAFFAPAQEKHGWVWAFGIAAVIYNPIIPVHLPRMIWFVINVETIAMALLSIFFLKAKSEKNSQPEDIEEGIEWIKVEGGTFQMGRASGLENEKPVHEVTLSDFWMSATEITFKQYDAFCEATHRKKPKDQGWGREKRPVINVSWHDAVAFCEWIDARLPTEAEWKYAARGGRKSRGYEYAGSNVLDDVGWYGGNSGEETHPVGTKQPNELGLYDMSGNVWEWCSDWYGDYNGDAQRDPVGACSGEYRVLRGGCWENGTYFCQHRSGYKPSSRYNYIGFRVCRGGSAR